MRVKKLDKPFTHPIGTINFAHHFFDLQKTVPQDRYVEEERRKKQEIKVPEHIKQFLKVYLNKAK